MKASLRVLHVAGSTRNASGRPQTMASELGSGTGEVTSQPARRADLERCVTSCPICFFSFQCSTASPICTTCFTGIADGPCSSSARVTLRVGHVGDVPSRMRSATGSTMNPRPHFVPRPRQRVLQATIRQLASLPKDQGSVPDQTVWTSRWICQAAAK
jgi:hypothetical protein